MNMLFLWVAILLLIGSVISFLTDKKGELFSKRSLILYLYAALFVYYAKITSDPIALPYGIGEVSPDAVFVAITGVSGYIVSKIYNFFMSFRKSIDEIKTELSGLKNTLDKHTSVCKEKHDGLDKRISNVESKKR